MIVDDIPVDEEPEVSTIPEILEDKVEKEKGYYRCVYVMLRFKNEAGIGSKEEQADVEGDPLFLLKIPFPQSENKRAGRTI